MQLLMLRAEWRGSHEPFATSWLGIGLQLLNAAGWLVMTGYLWQHRGGC